MTPCPLGRGGESQRHDGVAGDNLVRPAVDPEYHSVTLEMGELLQRYFTSS